MVQPNPQQDGNVMVSQNNPSALALASVSNAVCAKKFRAGRSATSSKYQMLIWLLVGVTVIFSIQSSSWVGDIPKVDQRPQAGQAPLQNITTITLKTNQANSSPDDATVTTSSPTASPVSSPYSYSPAVYVDLAQPYYKPLQNSFLLQGSGDLAETTKPNSTVRWPRVPPHGMDAVIMASAPDPTLAMCVHNLYHLNGFRRFIFVVNNATLCPILFDLVPQHNSPNATQGDPMLHRPPHVCLDHVSFYTADQRRRLQTDYPNLQRGAPGKLQRGTQMVQIPRLGWYLQQFSKLLIAQLVPDLSQRYLAVDGDLIFTRPFRFATRTKDPTTALNVRMPTTSKSPKHWRYFVDYIFGEEWSHNDTYNHGNFVVGWMVLDRTIVEDFIATVNHNIQTRHQDQDEFPFNILNEGERVINTTFFSEFYVYARYAMRYQGRVAAPYELYKIAEPARNPGNFQWTCILRKWVYAKAQSDGRKAPFLLWEEHKQHAFEGACPNGETPQTTQLSQVGIWHDFHPPPWGGGNQFLLALRRGLQDDWGMTIVAKNDPNGQDVIQNTSQVLLANSITFKGNKQVLTTLKEKDNLALVHRVDGPYYSTRYVKSLNITKPPPKLPEEDRKTGQINQEFACATVFQSQWSLEANEKIGLDLRNPVIIPNTVDPNIFYPSATKQAIQGRKLRIVATSHSDNARKGFDTMMWLDQHLDFDRFEFYYKGGTPKWDFEPRNIKVLNSEASSNVADFLREGDVYLAPSRYEPASNAVLEALACGLPVLYQMGSSHGELVGGGGRGFSKAGPDLLRALDDMADNYQSYREGIVIPTMNDVSRQYLSILRWCFYMKHVLLED